MLPWRCHRYQAATPAHTASIHVTQWRSSSRSRRRFRSLSNFKITSPPLHSPLVRCAAIGNRPFALSLSKGNFSLPKSKHGASTGSARTGQRVTAILRQVEAMRASGMLGQLVRFGIAGGISTVIYSAVYLPLAYFVLPGNMAVLAVPPAFLVA